MTISTGYDPRDFALFAYGGAGPVHVGAYARQLGVSRVYVPLHAPVQSAFGIATGEFRRHQTRAVPMREPYRTEAVKETCAIMETSMRADWQAAALDPDTALYQRFVDMRFRHQVHEIRVPLPPEDTAETLVRRFFVSYEQAFGKGSALAGSPNRDRDLSSRFDPASRRPHPHAQPKHRTHCACAHHDPRRLLRRGTHFDFRCSPWRTLGPGTRMEGPLIVESPNTTVVVHAGQTVEVDGYSNLGITV